MMKMHKILFILMVMTAGLVSCSSCSHPTPTPSNPDGAPTPSASVTVTPVPPIPVPTTVTVKLDNAEFTLPDGGWTQVQNPPAHSTAYLNMAKKNIVILVSEDYPGTYEQYVLMALRGIKDAGAQVASAKQVDVNGNKFVLVESSKNGVTAWMWVTWASNHGYGFSCGGPTSDATQKDLCSSIAGTLKIN